MKSDRWPPTYDAEQLARQIEDIAFRQDLYKGCYGSFSEGGICQGDLIQLDAEIPYLDENAEAVVEDGSGYWLVIGNTCDFERSRDQVRWTQVVPVTLVPDSAIANEINEGVRKYATTRCFHLPPWGGSESHHGIADFLRPVSVDKSACSKGTVKARLSPISWMLLHSCIVRFLARDDGRFDND